MAADEAIEAVARPEKDKKDTNLNQRRRRREPDIRE
jgi:hypothetical protein